MMLVNRQNVVVVGGSSGIEYAVDVRATSHDWPDMSAVWKLAVLV